MYVGPEFLLGEVYDGCVTREDEIRERVPLFRPIYITVVRSSQQRSASTAGKRKTSLILNY
jgi:hypothetical protein